MDVDGKPRVGDEPMVVREPRADGEADAEAPALEREEPLVAEDRHPDVVPRRRDDPRELGGEEGAGQRRLRASAARPLVDDRGRELSGVQDPDYHRGEGMG